VAPDNAQMKVILLKPGDEALLRDAEAAFYPEDAPSLERASILLREPTYVMAVALTDKGEIMSRVYGHVLHRFEATDFLIYEVDTVEEHKRKGAARAIIDLLKRRGSEWGWREMWVLTDLDNDEGNSFYEAIGGERAKSASNMYTFRL
jgi:GNAT superfamily N-acetyltransferase